MARSPLNMFRVRAQQLWDKKAGELEVRGSLVPVVIAYGDTSGGPNEPEG